MAVYVELVTELGGSTNLQGDEVAGKATVRRPLRGLELRDPAYAYIKLIRKDGVAIELSDSSAWSGRSSEYSNFILTNVQDQRMEKQQIIETFGSDYLMLFGEAPHFLQIGAVLVNSHDFDWKSEFLENYDKYLRGTRAIEQGARTYLFYNSAIVEGYILNAAITENAENEQLVPLQFQFFVTNFRNVRISDDTGNFPVRSSILLPEGVTVDTLRTSASGELLDALATSSGTGVVESGFALQEIQRDRVLRSRTAYNNDEYTGAPPTEPRQKTGESPQESELNGALARLDRLLGDLATAYGLDQRTAHGPRMMNGLGYGPNFARGGVGFGAFASASIGVSFGASIGASLGAGVSAGASIGAGFGVSAGASAGARLGASAGAGAYAGASANAGFSAGAGLGAGANSGFGIGTGTQAQYGVGAGYGAGAYAGASASAGVTAGAAPYAQAGTYSGSYSYTNLSQAGQAGGYGGANGSFAPGGYGSGFGGGYNSFGGPSAPGYNPAPGYQNGYGYGAGYGGGYGGAPGYSGQTVVGGSIPVGGSASAFGYASFGGTMTNVGVPPRPAVNNYSTSWGWHS